MIKKTMINQDNSVIEEEIISLSEYTQEILTATIYNCKISKFPNYVLVRSQYYLYRYEVITND